MTVSKKGMDKLFLENLAKRAKNSLEDGMNLQKVRLLVNMKVAD